MSWTALALGLVLPILPALARAEAPAAEAREPWSTAFYLDAYLQAGEDATFVPTVFADRGSLHLEARYNYEDAKTGSLFAGWAFPFGAEERSLKLTPMVGGVLGNTDGVAPGLEVEARWGRVGYWLEAEYLIDVNDSSASYLYTWSELTFSVVPWLWFGGSLQRLKSIETPTEVDVGPMVGVGKLGAPGGSFSFYVYGLRTSTQTYLLTGAAQF